MPYHLVLLNDNEHTFDYVIDMLMVNFSMPEDQAIEHAMDVHVNGRTIVMTCEKRTLKSVATAFRVAEPTPACPNRGAP
jgi:ATP-dependent Clp protease adapter protein ClpS